MFYKNIARVGATLVLVLLIAGVAQAPASGLRSTAACGTVVGPAWENPAFSKKGNKWVVNAKGVPCAFARTTAKRLMKTLWRGEAGTRLRGPAGWSCLPTLASTVGSKGTPGNCRNGSKTFWWAPAS
ncbi:MAG: hypothetical protein ACKVUT_02305 [Gaiella sp.]